ncbi:LRR receptor-like serine/threonine-protein kinase GSO1-like [Tripterygium wilfordii]|uniref:LRR receptor-like serine/threonine-protein kinase GSO1-like n=1 Tax=Tripterygium wilfordii TaxID=458696 RepID=A0A7J7CL04_TRIWF|nr:toll-like receptor 3 [Tripterygium wilfordii]KAF5734757.1 LRR receptor-like serine/threonine-protein kinase GSO1-like [Tripterygium wilfordii]
MEIGIQSRLVQMCIEAACESRETVEKWRRQRRTLERIPSPLADALLRRLLHRRLLFPSLLEAFKYTVEMIDLGGENKVDAEWMAYLGAFRYLSYLNVADCHRITNSALWALTGMTCLREIDISRCMKVTDAGIKHLLSISTLEKLRISETGLTADGVALLSSLKNLSVLDLGGLPVTDLALSSLQVLTRLQYLDLWGSKISDKGASMFRTFPKLSFLNLAWTSVTKVPNLSSLESLNLSNCTIDSLLEGDGDKAPLVKLILSGSTFINEAQAFLYMETSFLSFLDLSNSSLQRYFFLSHMNCLTHLDVSSSMMGDDLLEPVACIGENLRSLNLRKTKVSSAGVGILAGNVPNLEIISLSHTLIDDVAISYISLMPSVKVIDLSHTNIKGFVHQGGSEPDSSLLALQSLNHLECLNLEQTQVRDSALCFLSSFRELSQLSLRSASLTDDSLHHLSSLAKLIKLCIRDAVLTNCGLDSFKPPGTLKILDLRGCWLLTEDALFSFHKTNPLIDVWHEVVRFSPSNQNPSPSRKSSRSSQVKQNQGNLSVSQFFVDQRLKYSREELLALQYSSLSIVRSHT